MYIVLDLEEDLLIELKSKAKAEGVSLSALIGDMLSKSGKEKKPLIMIGKGYIPSNDIDDSYDDGVAQTKQDMWKNMK